MGVYIKGMEMPKSCAKCILFGEYGCPFIGAVGYALTEGKRNDDCPLVPVPPHGRLVDADALTKSLFHYFAKSGARDTLEALIRTESTIIPAEGGE